jgi:hypothetical protein
MAFGIPGSNDGGGSSGPFLARIQYDARTGSFVNVDRIQGADGAWSDRKSRPYYDPSFAVDFGSMEVGYIKLDTPPAFLMVPYFGEGRTEYPRQPDEMAAAKPGETPRKAFLPGFRLKVMSSKTFGDSEPRYFSGNSKSANKGVENLYKAFTAAPEASAGKIPVVVAEEAEAIETKGPKGTTRNFAPRFRITSWIDRPAGFGERTVPPPGGAMPAAPRPAPVQQAARQPVPEMAAAAAMAAAELDEPLPF